MTDKKIKPADPKAVAAPEANDTEGNAGGERTISRVGKVIRKSGRKTSGIRWP
ncbi:hypothetical protein M6D93_04570 [Jatrophihabitans telluris]|uniref:Uncharacterized protein n=1 Tax=Jatrophihabitans telluris TaxID=2038343 RepID=A0ABY4R291_9ACTN|nr:hypothetical protein [Jatrophihabitans telluris]UQX89281.1 hypothetical protein M6D93_04570 [Jatrophihabitans telluris]